MASPIGVLLMGLSLTHIGKGQLGKRLVLLFEITHDKNFDKNIVALT